MSEINTTCPGCGAGNAMRASNQMNQIYCGRCGWVEDPDWDGPDTLTEVRNDE